MKKSFIEKICVLRDLIYRTKEARAKVEEKKNAITTCAWVDKKKSCLQFVEIRQSYDPSVVGSDSFYCIVRNCKKFSDCNACTDAKCKMRKQNNEYIGAVRAFEALKKMRTKAFKSIFTRSK